jgi:hypothetical protein
MNESNIKKHTSSLKTLFIHEMVLAGMLPVAATRKDTKDTKFTKENNRLHKVICSPNG